MYLKGLSLFIKTIKPGRSVELDGNVLTKEMDRKNYFLVTNAMFTLTWS